MEKAGDLPQGTAQRWADETPDIKSLPARVKKPKKSKKSFTKGFKKTASTGWNLTEDAAEESRFAQMQNGVPGATLRADAETGQARGRATRTKGVLNENREMDSRYRKPSETARGGGATRLWREK